MKALPPSFWILRPGRPGLAAGAMLVAASCAPRVAPGPTVIPPLPLAAYDAGAAGARVNGPVSSEQAAPKVAFSAGSAGLPSLAAAGIASGPANISYDFADTDIREVAAQILGNTLHVNYTIDPAVHGTATLRTVTPLSANQLLPVLQSMLAQNGATLTQSRGVYRVLPTAAAQGVAGADGTAGGMMVPLRYASAEDLAKVLQPYAQGGARIVAVPSANALVIAGEPAQRDALADLVRAFDVDVLAGQSYALFPVSNGDAQDFSDALKQAFRAQQGAPLANQIRVVPMARVNAVLVIASSARYINDARRVYAVVERGRRQTMRTWHVYYLQNSTANDIAYILQEAFTPDNVTAQPTARGSGQPSNSGGSGIGGIAGLGGSGSSGSSSGSSSGLGGSGSSSGLGGDSSSGGLGSSGLGSGGGIGSHGSGGQGAPTTVSAGATSSNPLLGGISNSGGSSGGAEATAMRIISNPENNAVLIYATAEEAGTAEAMLHKIDILPLQVRIDAVIAEVTLNDSLQYGTQFFFKHHGINGGLSEAASGPTAFANAAASVLPLPATALPNFVFNAAGKDGDLVLNALQGVTTVKVLSSPELLVLDNETAQLQVGNLVPYLTGSTTNLTGSTSITNTVDYRKTGVITQVTPRVNSGGLVTLDIAQEVSGVAPSSATAGNSGSTIQSPTFTERSVQSRVVVQDGQTVGIAGLITDQATTGNTGLPWIKDIPVLGLFAGNQNNSRNRTELLVLLTPHVLHDQRDARALTEDLREQLSRAAAAPYELNDMPLQGSPDPNAKVRRALRLSK